MHHKECNAVAFWMHACLFLDRMHCITLCVLQDVLQSDEAESSARQGGVVAAQYVHQVLRSCSNAEGWCQV